MMVIFSVSLVAVQFGDVRPAAATNISYSDEVATVRVTVRVVVVGANYELEVQLIDKPAGAPDELIEGATYHLRYPVKRSKLRGNDPVMFAAVGRLRANDVVEVEFLTDAAIQESRGCYSNGRVMVCSDESTKISFDLVSVGVPQGSCLRGTKKTIRTWSYVYSLRTVLCLRRGDASTTVAGFVTDMSGEVINGVSVTLSERGTIVVAVASTPGDIAWVDLGRQIPDGRYWLAGCLDIKDDGKDCKPSKAASVNYRSR